VFFIRFWITPWRATPNFIRNRIRHPPRYSGVLRRLHLALAMVPCHNPGFCHQLYPPDRDDYQTNLRTMGTTTFRPLDDLLGDSSIESQGRFAGVRWLTFRLELEVYRVPRKYSMKQEFAEELAARYVKSEFFPKAKERFERGDRSSGGFWVVVVPKFHRLR